MGGGALQPARCALNGALPQSSTRTNRPLRCTPLPLLPQVLLNLLPNIFLPVEEANARWQAAAEAAGWAWSTCGADIDPEDAEVLYDGIHPTGGAVGGQLLLQRRPCAHWPVAAGGQQAPPRRRRRRPCPVWVATAGRRCPSTAHAVSPTAAPARCRRRLRPAVCLPAARGGSPAGGGRRLRQQHGGQLRVTPTAAAAAAAAPVHRGPVAVSFHCKWLTKRAKGSKETLRSKAGNELGASRGLGAEAARSASKNTRGMGKLGTWVKKERLLVCHCCCCCSC